MRSRKRKSTSGNAFDLRFLRRFDLHDEQPLFEALTAGPWRVEPIHGAWGVYAEGESQATAILDQRDLALLAAAAFPPSGLPPRFTLRDAPTRPFPILEHGRPVGYLNYFHPELTSAMSIQAETLRNPSSLAYLLESAGSSVLARTGKILASRVLDREGRTDDG